MAFSDGFVAYLCHSVSFLTDNMYNCGLFGGSFLLSPDWKSPQTHTLESTGSLHSQSPSSRCFTDGIYFILHCESFGLMRSLCFVTSMSLAYIFILGVKGVIVCTNTSEKFWTAYMPNGASYIMQQRPSRWGVAHWKRGVFLTDVKSWESPLALLCHQCSRHSHPLGLTCGFHFRLAILSSQITAPFLDSSFCSQ